MIRLRLVGGLGNQLFQISCALYFSKKFSKDIHISTFGLKSYSAKREYSLPEILNLESVSSNKIIVDSSIISFIVNKLRLGLWMPFWSINDRNINKRKDINSQSNFIMDGYFQDFWDKKDFFYIASILKKHLKIQSFENAPDKNSLYVHIRGGDFIGHSQLEVVDFSWYLRAIKRALDENKFIKRIVIISEDRKCSEKLKLYLDGKIRAGIHIAKNQKMAGDFFLISQCKLKIIGNSTFTFWAHALGQGKAYSPPYKSKNIKRPWQLTNEIFVE